MPTAYCSITKEDADGTVSITYFDAEGNATGDMTTQIDPNGSGSTVTMTAPNGTTIVMSKDADGRVFSIATTDANGDTATTYLSQDGKAIGELNVDQLNGGGSSSTVIGSNGSTFTVDTDANGRPVTVYVRDANGDVTTTQLDAQGNVIGQTLIEQDPNNNTIATITGPDNSSLTYVRDALGVLRSSSYDDGSGNTGSSSYDASGKLTSSADTKRFDDGRTLTVFKTFDVDGQVQTEDITTTPASDSNADTSQAMQELVSDFLPASLPRLEDSWLRLSGGTTAEFQAEINAAGDVQTGTLSAADAYGDQLQSTVAADGTVVTAMLDAQGDTETDTYDAFGQLVSDTWQDAWGDYGTDTYNADGSGHSEEHDGDGSLYVDDWAADGSGSGYYQQADGGYGSYFYNADGTSHSEDHYADGGFYVSDQTADGSSSDSWQYGDGSYGNDAYNAEGSGHSESHYADGTFSIYDWDAEGDWSDSYLYADGSHGSDNVDALGVGHHEAYQADGSYQINDQYADDSSSDSYGDSEGNYGSDFYGADGSYHQEWHAADGESYSIADGDAAGDSSSSYQYADGTHGASAFDSTGVGYSENDYPDGSYELYEVTAPGTWSDLHAYADGSSDLVGGNDDGSYFQEARYADGLTWFHIDYNVDGSTTDSWSDAGGNSGTDEMDADGFGTIADFAPAAALDDQYMIRTAELRDGVRYDEADTFSLLGDKLEDQWSYAGGAWGGDVFFGEDMVESEIHDSPFVWSAITKIEDSDGSYESNWISGNHFGNTHPTWVVGTAALDSIAVRDWNEDYFGTDRYDALSNTETVVGYDGSGYVIDDIAADGTSTIYADGFNSADGNHELPQFLQATGDSGVYASGFSASYSESHALVGLSAGGWHIDAEGGSAGDYGVGATSAAALVRDSSGEGLWVKNQLDPSQQALGYSPLDVTIWKSDGGSDAIQSTDDLTMVQSYDAATNVRMNEGQSSDRALVSVWTADGLLHDSSLRYGGSAYSFSDEFGSDKTRSESFGYGSASDGSTPLYAIQQVFGNDSYQRWSTGYGGYIEGFTSRYEASGVVITSDAGAGGSAFAIVSPDGNVLHPDYYSNGQSTVVSAGGFSLERAVDVNGGVGFRFWSPGSVQTAGNSAEWSAADGSHGAFTLVDTAAHAESTPPTGLRGSMTGAQTEASVRIGARVTVPMATTHIARPPARVSMNTTTPMAVTEQPSSGTMEAIQTTSLTQMALMGVRNSTRMVPTTAPLGSTKHGTSRRTGATQ